jgi:hypothetical protein
LSVESGAIEMKRDLTWPIRVIENLLPREGKLRLDKIVGHEQFRPLNMMVELPVTSFCRIRVVIDERD